MSLAIAVESSPVACYVLNRRGLSIIASITLANLYGFVGREKGGDAPETTNELTPEQENELASEEPTGLSPEEIEAHTYRDLTLTISSAEGFFDTESYTLDCLAPGELSRLMPNVIVDPDKLRTLAESVDDEVIVSIADKNGKISERRFPLLVLAPDYWPWVVFPESVASWVNPNEPGLRKVRDLTIENLRALTGVGSLDGYQSGDKNRVLAMATAAFDAIKAQKLTYATLSPSAGGLGQRLRPPHTVLTEGIGNCIDLAVLYCSLLEGMGLNPFVIMIDGHAFAGLWLEERTFSEVAVTAPSALVNRLEKGIEQIALVECTTLSQDSEVDFAEASRHARATILQEGRFNACIDIRRARGGGLRPLFTGRHGEIAERTRDLLAPEIGEVPAQSSAPTTSGAHTDFIDSTDLTPQSKIEVWEKGLLDLTMRNALLNMRLGRSLVVFATLDIDAMEDVLAQAQKLSIGPKPAEFAIPDNSFEVARALAQYTDLFADELKQKRIRALQTPQMLDATLKDLSRKAQLSISESGANTLYLSLGALRWFRPGDPAPRYAPILLVPVELSRKSASSGYTVEIRDEEVMLNITLLEHLRRNFGMSIGGLNPLPQDEHGVDTRKVFNTFRNRILDMPNWELFEVACLGIFKFSNFVLWDDIHRHADKLAKSPVVNSLMNGHLTWKPDKLELPEKVTAEDAVIAIEADASQLYAIKTANAGHSFVLHGPPGTGKSQVITGIIANALAHGKRVLFVAEKAAALNVVQDRLDKMGIGAYCLSIHSHQTNKTHILQQLQAALDQSRMSLTSSAFLAQRDTVEQLKGNLDAYSDALNAVNTAGLTTREQISRYLALGAARSLEELTTDQPHPQVLPEAYLNRITSMDVLDNDLRALKVLVAETENLQRRGRSVADNPLRFLGTAVTTRNYQAVMGPAFDAALSQSAAASAAVSSSLHSATITALFERLSLSVPQTMDEVRQTAELCAMLAQPSALPVRWYMEPNLPAVVGDCQRLLNEIYSAQQLVAKCSAEWKPTLFGLDYGALKAQWEDAQKFRLFGSGGAKRKVAEQIQPHGVNHVTAESVPQVLAILDVFQHHRAVIRDLAARLEPFLVEARVGFPGYAPEGVAGYASADDAGALNLNEGIDTAKLGKWVAYVSSGPSELTDPLQRRRLTTVLEAATRGDLSYSTTLGPLTSQLKECAAAFDALRARVRTLSGGDALNSAMPASAPAQNSSAGQGGFTGATSQRTQTVTNGAEDALPATITLTDLAKRVDALQNHRMELGEWVRWCDIAEQVHKVGLSATVLALSQGADPALIVDAVSKSVFERMVRRSVADHVALARFSGAEMSELIRQYRAADSKLRAVARTYVKETLALRASGLDTSTKKYAQLTKAINSRGRNLNMRQLLSESADVVGSLTPVMLMSPLAVAQYLDLDAEPFDLVIFDEASQLPTCKAVGALARGRSAVIVGDPKQMPPTAFFSTKEQSEDMTELSDLESILDDCLAINIPQTYLEWHYRSKHESLIGFSNEQFYDAKLCTFPSSREDQSQVKYVHVPGHYAGDGVNEFEAKAIVRELRRRYLVDPAAATCSIGIITFNIRQQITIEDLLEQEFMADPQFEAWSRAGAEPLFVKNLENVQGDERDTILFSITYAPDENGQMAMRFGPINNQGGERRLNVAFTRSREEMMIFSTLQPDDIDLRRSSARGVRILKNFLQYAQSGRFAGTTLRTSETADGIADGIAAALVARGYRCDRNVGSSSMRIDIAVKMPVAEPGEEASGYIAGILLDGPSYRAARSTRDRELAHSNVLTNLGWNVIRVWALEWWRDPDFVVDTLVQQIEDYVAASRDAARAQLEEEQRRAAAEAALEARSAGASVVDASAQTDAPSVTGASGDEAASGAGALSGASGEGSEEGSSAAGSVNGTAAVSTGTGRHAAPGEGAAAGTSAADVPGTDTSTEGALRTEGAVHPRTTAAAEVTGATASAADAPTVEVVKYTEVELPTDVVLTADEYNSANDELIMDRIRLLMNAEAPIDRDLLVRCVRESFGLSRSGKLVQRRTEDLIERTRMAVARGDDKVFLWRHDQDPEAYAVVRATSSEQSRHNIEVVPPEEIIAAFIAVLAEKSVGTTPVGSGVVAVLECEDLFAKASRLLGYNRRTNRVVKCLESALAEAESRNVLRKLGTSVSIAAGLVHRSTDQTEAGSSVAPQAAAPEGVPDQVNPALTPLRSRLAEPLDLGADCPARLLFIDFETPSLKGDRVCSVGYVLTDLAGGVLDEQHFLVDPECEFSQQSIKVHGIRSIDVVNEPNFVEIWNKHLGKLVRSSWLVAHNANFDMQVLYRTLAAYGLDNLDLTATCTLQLCRSTLENTERFTLPECARALGVDMEGEHHNARSDARACAEIFFALAGQDKLKPSDFRFWPKPAVVGVGTADAPAAPHRTRSEENTALQRLFVHLERIIADGVVTPAEAIEVRNLLRNDALTARQAVIAPLRRLVDEVFADGIVELAEADKLYHEIVKLLNPVTDEVAQEFTRGLQGKKCVVTGDFDYGPRPEVEAYIREQGGQVVGSVSRRVDYVIMGSRKSDAWKFANYGTKVKRALELREQGYPILIIQEEQLFNM